MKGNFIILLVACLLPLAAGLAMYGQKGAVLPPSVPDAGGVTDTDVSLPAFSFTDTKGAEHHISDYKGKVVILNFWATWCAPCQIEFPRLLSLAAAHQDRVVLIALSADENTEVLPRFFARLDPPSRKALEGHNVVIGLDGKKEISQTLFQTYRLPETILAGPDLVMRRKFVGAGWQESEMDAEISKILKGAF